MKKLLIVLCLLGRLSSAQDSSIVSLNLVKIAAIHHAEMIYGPASFYSIIPYHNLDGEINVYCIILKKVGGGIYPEEILLNNVNQSYEKIKDLKNEIIEIQKLDISGKRKAEKIKEIKNTIERTKSSQSYKDEFITVLAGAHKDHVPVIMSYEGLPLHIVQKPMLQEKIKAEPEANNCFGEVYYLSMFNIYYGLIPCENIATKTFNAEIVQKKNNNLTNQLFNIITLQIESVTDIENRIDLRAKDNFEGARVLENQNDKYQRKEILKRKWKEIESLHLKEIGDSLKREANQETTIQKVINAEKKIILNTQESINQEEKIYTDDTLRNNKIRTPIDEKPQNVSGNKKGSYVTIKNKKVLDPIKSLTENLDTISTSIEYSREAQGSHVIFSEDFNGPHPGEWTIGHDGGVTSYIWDWPSNYAQLLPNQSGLPYYYPNNLHVYMERRNLSLVGFSGATLSFYKVVDTQTNADEFTVNVRDQYGSWHLMHTESGPTSPLEWEYLELDLSDFDGQSGLYIQFRFDSDGSIPGGYSYNGVFIENVALTANPSSQPNLTPYQPSEWDDRIIVSAENETHTDGEIYQHNVSYIDVAWINNGGTDAGVHRANLYLDDNLIVYEDVETLAVGYYRYWNDFDFTFTEPGWHSLKLVVDVNNDVDESDESDNEYERQIYVNPVTFNEVVISGVPDYAQNDYPHTNNPGGICVSTCLADIMGYWDRNSYWNLIDNGTAPLLDYFSDGNVEETVEWFRAR